MMIEGGFFRTAVGYCLTIRNSSVSILQRWFTLAQRGVFGNDGTYSARIMGFQCDETSFRSWRSTRPFPMGLTTSVHAQYGLTKDFSFGDVCKVAVLNWPRHDFVILRLLQ